MRALLRSVHVQCSTPESVAEIITKQKNAARVKRYNGRAEDFSLGREARPKAESGGGFLGEGQQPLRTS